MTDDGIRAITLPLTIVLVVGMSVGGILYDNYLDEKKLSTALNLGCIVTEIQSKTEYDCESSKRTKLQENKEIIE